MCVCLWLVCVCVCGWCVCVCGWCVCMFMARVGVCMCVFRRVLVVGNASMIDLLLYVISVCKIAVNLA